MTENPIDTHRLKIDFGRYKGELWTRIPISYLKWLINENSPARDIAQAELTRRGTSLNYDVELSAHAVDRASLVCLDLWRMTAYDNEGIYSWLHRHASAASKMSRGEMLITKA